MKDIALGSYEGDITLAEYDGTDQQWTGTYDIALTDSATEDLKQVIYNRLNTQNPDWFVHPIMGADLEEMIGEPNTRASADRIIVKISKALNYIDPVTQTRMISPYNYSVRVIPVDADTVLVVVTINDTRMFIDFSYSHGIQEVGIL